MNRLRVIISLGILFLLALVILSRGYDPELTQAQTQVTATPHLVNLSLPPVGDDEPTYSKMDSLLNDLAEQAQAGLLTSHVASLAPVSDDDTVAVSIFFDAEYTDSVREHLRDNGIEPRNIGDSYIEAYVPVSLLPDLSERDGIGFIRVIIPPEPTQLIELGKGGITAHAVAPWHAAGYKGRGVKVGVIDAGFDGFSPSLPYLPTPTAVRCYSSVGRYSPALRSCWNGSDHGTFVTEALYSIAPEAEYYLADPYSQGDIVDIVRWMAGQGVDVINMSLSWSWVGPGDGTSPYYTQTVLHAVDEAVTNGMVYSASAGNNALSNWRGPFTDPDGDGWHNFDGGTECNPFEVRDRSFPWVLAQLRWEDSWGGGFVQLWFIPL